MIIRILNIYTTRLSCVLVSFFFFLYICSVVFKGDPSESAVLCTNTKTYDVKEAETSNSILLIPELSFPDEKCSNTELIGRKVSIYSVFY